MVSRVIPSVGSVESAFMAMMSFMHTAGTSMNVAISVTGDGKGGSNNTTSTTIPWNSTFERIIFCARIKNAWIKSLSFSNRKWI